MDTQKLYALRAAKDAAYKQLMVATGDEVTSLLGAYYAHRKAFYDFLVSQHPLDTGREQAKMLAGKTLDEVIAMLTDGG